MHRREPDGAPESGDGYEEGADPQGREDARGPAENGGWDDSGLLRCFGKQVKLCRERARLTQAELGARLGYGVDLVSSVERGRRIPKPAMIDRADEVLAAGGLLTAMKPQLERVRYPSFFRYAAKLEAEAVELHVYDTHIVNGLLQTEDYARAVFTMWRPLLDEETIERRVAARLERQEIFERRSAPMMSFVLEEAPLRRPLGGKQVLRGQLRHLLSVGRKRNVEVQVMPSSREESAGNEGPFTLLTLKGHEEVAYLEAQSRSTVITTRSEVRSIASRYGIIRAQALTPRESLAFIEELLGEV